MKRMTMAASAGAMALTVFAVGAAEAGPADFDAYYENSQRLASPHAYYGESWPHFTKNDHNPHYDQWGRDLNGPPFRSTCDGMDYGTGDYSCGTRTGGPVGGLESRN